MPVDRALALRAYLRFLAPLALLSAAVFAPYLWLAWHTPAPTDPAGIRAIVKLAWLSLAYVYRGAFPVRSGVQDLAIIVERGGDHFEQAAAVEAR